MFTGIVELIGKIKKYDEKEDIHQYTIIASNEFLNDVNEGESICVNGVCLTAYDINNDQFMVDVSTETRSCTTFANLNIESKVNLEKSVTPISRLGGHLVSGHVDALARVVSREDKDNETKLWIETPKNLRKYIAKKGSICINGVSLTINQLESEKHCLTIIPYTLKHTILSEIKKGDFVNIEVDLIARYIEQLNS